MTIMHFFTLLPDALFAPRLYFNPRQWRLKPAEYQFLTRFKFNYCKDVVFASPDHIGFSRLQCVVTVFYPYQVTFPQGLPGDGVYIIK